MANSNVINFIYIVIFNYLLYRNSTLFEISYLPKEYGKLTIGKLIISTDETLWMYDVKGAHEDYKPPVIKKSNYLSQTRISQLRLDSKSNNYIN